MFGPLHTPTLQGSDGERILPSTPIFRQLARNGGRYVSPKVSNVVQPYMNMMLGDLGPLLCATDICRGGQASTLLTPIHLYVCTRNSLGSETKVWNQVMIQLPRPTSLSTASESARWVVQVY